jgi:hypothetical protein
MVLVVHIDISLNNTNDSIIVMVKCGVLFEVRTEFLNIILMKFGFEGFNNRLISTRLHCATSHNTAFFVQCR